MANPNDFIVAITKNDLPTVQRLVEKGVGINETNKYHESALITAILERNLDIINFLIENGGNLNLKFKKGYTPLHYSVENDSYEVTKLLIEKGANVNAVDNFGNTPLWYCCAVWNKNSDARIIKLLLSQQAKIDIKNKFGLDISSWFDKKDGLLDVFKT